ncbi:alpha-L-rhamnosidase [Trichococcus pasteurii]|uniref:alpha-L-rhamnosidase n=1 Tax=Trichococcus pasteurii TaxID=43064 RepID=A0A1W1IGT6_9LACT|nr:alpha-L-rhamnosidase [Trichococcus pasteurii]SFE96509.1 alpha-L-rhamnosidase [Trichococcus pasteurii]SLM51993.1 bacterial alpha-l-rhamnosidase [Trichococcus pasteurii]SSB92874.1 bacterial alpha-l-rhamnosidase [Trichococcus pasteurii]
MLRISSLTVEGLEKGCVTDKAPILSFSLYSDVPGEAFAHALIKVNDWEVNTKDQINNRYDGPLVPFAEYTVEVTAYTKSGASAKAATVFQTGRLHTPWSGKWITDLDYEVPEKLSPLPMNFLKSFKAAGKIKRAWINCTALGVYEVSLNGKKVGEDYFAPGFTSYLNQIQYQTYEITGLLEETNELRFVVAGGWAVGAFNYIRKNKISADRQALLAEIHLEYEDGSSRTVATDDTWMVSLEGNYRMAEWYDGETYDARISENAIGWKSAGITKPRKDPKIIAQYGLPVRRQEKMRPISLERSPSGEWIYDFGQNFAGVISARIKGVDGQKLVFRHAEVLVEQELFVKSLRTAKATATYICKDGEQHYSPKLTYMGFRYVGVSGIAPEDLVLEAFVLHSDLKEIGQFACSNPLLNQLQSNIRWGGKSNFVDIPTDCPQRDERQGWTGDIAVFASTACYNFDMSRFFDKWLVDMRSEQGRGGGYPMVIPKAGDHWPTMASSCWGDSAILVPWAAYLSGGRVEVLEEHYASMQRFLKAAKWWASFLATSPTNSHIWQFPFHFGDWAAPEGQVKDWLKKGKWIGTAYFANSCRIMGQIAEVLDRKEDQAYYEALREKIIIAYRKAFTDEKGNLKQEFQTGYVLPLHFDMVDGKESLQMAANLSRLIREAENHLTTGFTGTPYILFALSDNGKLEEAYELLLQETCPSWLYAVKAGGTTIWERWDALRPDGTVNIEELSGKKSNEESAGGMVSFNHYANGAVGDWLYKRLLGLEPVTGGYRSFQVKPMIGGGITWAKGSTITPYGKIEVEWKIEGNSLTIAVDVPVSTTCQVVFPSGEQIALKSGYHEICEPYGQ